MRDHPAWRGRPGLLLGSWAVLLLIFALLAPIAQRALGIPFGLVSFVMFAPGLASIIVLLRPRWMPSAWPRASAARVALATAGAVVAALAFTAALASLVGRMPSLDAPGIGAPLGLFLALQILGVLSEEIGWRGVAQRAGEQFARPAVVSAVAGFLFGATHLGYWSLGPLALLTFSLAAVLLNLTITTLFTGTFWQRMIPATIVHLGVNLAIASLALADEPLGTTLPALAAAAAMFVVATIIKIVTRRASGQNQRDLA